MRSGVRKAVRTAVRPAVCKWRFVFRLAAGLFLPEDGRLLCRAFQICLELLSDLDLRGAVRMQVV